MINMKKMTTTMAAVAMLAATPLTAFAAPVGAQLSDPNPSNGEVPVTLSVEANYKVELPASVTLEYETDGVFVDDSVFASDYDITVKGFIPAAQALQITSGDVDMAGDANFTVENYMAGSTKEAKVQTVKVAGADVTEDGKTVTNRFEHSSDGIGAGSYTGTVSFAYKLVAAE